MPLDRAVDEAIDYCIADGILKEFLIKNKSEVRSMSLYEFDAEKHEKTIKQIAYEDGYDNGYDSGYGSGYGSGYDNGYGSGEKDGIAKGKQLGITAEQVEEVINRQSD